MRLLRPNLNNRPTVPGFWAGYLILAALLVLAGLTVSQLVSTIQALLS